MTAKISPAAAQPQAKTAQGRARPWRVEALLIVVVAIVAYSGSFSVPLLFDDIPAIENNLSIRHWSGVLQPPIDTTAGGRPVLNLTLAANYAIGGTSAVGYHVVNLTIHLLAGLTLFGVLRRTLAAQPAGLAAAFAAALFWTLHPLQTESVTYVVQRAESLMGWFYLLTLYGFIRGAATQGRAARGWFALAFGACLLGMGTKEVMVSAPLLVLLYDRTFLAGSFAGAWRVRGRVHLALASTWLVLLGLVLSTQGRGGSAGLASGISLTDYWLTQPPAVLRYLGLTIWPHPLVFYYGTERVGNVWAVLPAAGVLLALFGATVWALFRPAPGLRALGFGGVLFFATLAPTSVVPILLQTAAEHRMYLALVPLLVLVAHALFRWGGRAAWPACALLAGVLALLTWLRNADYRSVVTIWTDTVVKMPGNARARYNLGHALESEPGRLDEAIEQYRAALRLQPDLAEARTNLGSALLRQGRGAESLAELEEALRLVPDSAQAHNNLGNALAKAPGRLPEAIEHFQAAVRRKPDYVEARTNLGAALAAAGRPAEAIAEYEAALRLDPRHTAAHYNLGNVLVLAGRRSEAIPAYEEAVRLKPDFVEAHFNLAVTLLQLSIRREEAVEHLRQVLRLQPRHQPARRILEQLGIAP